MHAQRFRNLGGQLQGIVFDCPTQAEVEKLFTCGVRRAPKEQMEYLKFLKVDRPAFVFDAEKRLLHGVLKVDSPAELISQHHWSQPVVEIKLSVFTRYAPLRECEFSPKIQLCYHCALEFYFELDMEETLEIMELFHESLGRGGSLNKKNGLISGCSSSIVDQADLTARRQWEKRKETVLTNMGVNTGGGECAGGGSEAPKTPRTVHERSERGGGKHGGGAAERGKDKEETKTPTRVTPNALDRNGWRASLASRRETDNRVEGDGGGGGGGICLAPSPPPNAGTSDDSQKYSQVGTCGTDPSDTESISNNSGDVTTQRIFNNIVPRRRCSSTSQQSAGFGVGSLPVSFGTQSQNVRPAGDGSGAVVTQQMALCFGSQGGGASEGTAAGGAPNVQLVIQTRAEVSSQTNGSGVVTAERGAGQAQAQHEDGALKLEIQRLTSEVDFLKRENIKLDQEKDSARKRTEDDRVLLRTQAELLRQMQSDADTCRRNTEDIVIARRREQEAHVAQNRTLQEENNRLLKETDRLSGLVETLTCTRSNESARLQKENAQLNSTLQMLRSEMEVMWNKNDGLQREIQRMMEDRTKATLANEELMLHNESLRQRLAEGRLAAKAYHASCLGDATPSHPPPQKSQAEGQHLPCCSPRRLTIPETVPSQHLSLEREHNDELELRELPELPQPDVTVRAPVESGTAHNVHGAALCSKPCQQGRIPEIVGSDLPLTPYGASDRCAEAMVVVSSEPPNPCLPSSGSALLVADPLPLPLPSQSDFQSAGASRPAVPTDDANGKVGGVMGGNCVEGAPFCGQHDNVPEVSTPVHGVGENCRSEEGLEGAVVQTAFVNPSAPQAPQQPALESHDYATPSVPGFAEPSPHGRGDHGKMDAVDMRANQAKLPSPVVAPLDDSISPSECEQPNGEGGPLAPSLPAGGAESCRVHPTGVEKVEHDAFTPHCRSSYISTEVNQMVEKYDSLLMLIPHRSSSVLHPPVETTISTACHKNVDSADGQVASPPAADVSLPGSELVCTTTAELMVTSVEQCTLAGAGHQPSGGKHRMYILGGTNEDECEMEMSEVYDFERGSWTPAPDCSLPPEAGPTSLATVSVGRNLYVVGGMSEDSDGTGYFYMFSPDSGCWTRLVDLPTRRSAVGLVECDGKIVAVGGRTEENCLMAVEVYDPERNQWFEGPPLKHRRAYHSTVVCDGSIFAVGGMRDPSGVMKSAEHLDLRRGRWESVGRMSKRRTALGCASNQQYIMVAGGVSCDDYGRDFCILKSTEVFDPRVNMWYVGPSMMDPRAWCCLNYFDGAMYAIGGRISVEGEINTGMEKFELGKDGRWCALESPTKRAFHSCCVVEG